MNKARKKQHYTKYLIQNTQGFTLIELLVVIAIVGLLGSIIFANLSGSRDKARIAKAQEFAWSSHNTLGVEIAGHWSMEDAGGGITSDSSGNGNDAALGTVVQKTEAECGLGFGKCLEYDGSNTVSVNVPHTIYFDDKSFSGGAWFKFYGNVSGYKYILFNSFNQFVSEAVALGVNTSANGYLSLQSVGMLQLTGGPALDDGNWHHIFFSLNRVSNNAELYVDGNKVSEGVGAFTADFGSLADQEGPFALPFNIGYSGFDGLIDEVRIYKQALTASEVGKLYAEGAKKFFVRK